jgi:hypothetical protein
MLQSFPNIWILIYYLKALLAAFMLYFLPGFWWGVSTYQRRLDSSSGRKFEGECEYAIAAISNYIKNADMLEILSLL